MVAQGVLAPVVATFSPSPRRAPGTRVATVKTEECGDERRQHRGSGGGGELVQRRLLGRTRTACPWCARKSGRPAAIHPAPAAGITKAGVHAGDGPVADQGVLHPAVSIVDRAEIVPRDPAGQGVDLAPEVSTEEEADEPPVPAVILRPLQG